MPSRRNHEQLRHTAFLRATSSTLLALQVLDMSENNLDHMGSLPSWLEVQGCVSCGDNHG